MLDMLARGPLWKDGMSYLHGTGHGIGSHLNVHEGPFGVGGGATHSSSIFKSESMQRRYLAPIELGYSLSDEPGFYLDGKFGVRLESDMISVPAETKYCWGERPYLRFLYTTPVPFCRRLIERALLSADEMAWLDKHHAQCRVELTPEIAKLGLPKEDEAAALAWLQRETESI